MGSELDSSGQDRKLTSLVVMNSTAISAAVFWLALVCQAGAGQETTGQWSAERQFLQARFVARYHSSTLDGAPGGPYSEFLVYLELRNTCPPSGTVSLNLDIDTATNIAYRVTDESGRVVEPERAVFRSTILPGVHRLELPADSNLRFSISVNGAGVYPDKTILDLAPQQGAWYFDRSTNRQFSLSGTLRLPHIRGRQTTRWWSGELQIPPVKLIIPGRPQPDAASTNH